MEHISKFSVTNFLFTLTGGILDARPLIITNLHTSEKLKVIIGYSSKSNQSIQIQSFMYVETFDTIQELGHEEYKLLLYTQPYYNLHV